MSVKPERSSYSPLDFREWFNSKSLELSPKFQRRNVWPTPKRSFLIDTILQELPVPPVYIRVRQSKDRTKIIREVIDGQQRLRSVLDFMAGEYSLSRTLSADYAGKTFDKLTEEQKRCIEEYSFNCEVFKGVDDATVLEVFARVNNYAAQLNAQELRNGKYFGHFKQLAFRLGTDYLEFWRQNKVLTESKIARMAEAELVSELLVAQLAGMQDKKSTLEDFYQEYDETFASRKTCETRFRTTMDEISSIIGEEISSTEFRRPPMFYSLFCVVFHRLYGLPERSEATPKKGRLSGVDRTRLGDAVLELSDILLEAKGGGSVRRADQMFVSACQRQTDNIQPRNRRFSSLYSRAF